jgi:monoamine oxidase
MMKTLQIMIIGAGVSGLTTGYRITRLKSQFESWGIQVQVHLVEARKRLGGRIHTVKLREMVAELGGQYLDDANEGRFVHALCKELGVPTKVVLRPTASYLIDNENPPSYISIYDHILPLIAHESENNRNLQLAQLEKVCKTLDEVIDAYFDDKIQQAILSCNAQKQRAYELFKVFIKRRLQTFEGRPVSELSAGYATTSLQFFLEATYKKSSWLRQRQTPEEVGPQGLLVMEGNGHLINTLEQKILGPSATITRGLALKSLDKSTDGPFELTFSDESVMLADIVILTLPASEYHNITFSQQAIPPEQLAAIRRIKLSPITKLQIPVWSHSKQPLSGLTFSSQALTWLSPSLSPTADAAQVLSVFATGQSELLQPDFLPLSQPHLQRNNPRNFSAQQAFITELQHLETLFPDCRFFDAPENLAIDKAPEAQLASIEQAVGVNWACEPFSHGGYSAITPDTADLFSSDQIEDFLGVPILKSFRPHLPKGSEKEPQGLYFAGEHTHPDFPATIEGAVSSGERAAQQFLTRMQQLFEKN